MNKKGFIIWVLFLFMCSNMSFSYAQYAGWHKDKQIVKPEVEIKAYAFDLDKVKLLPSPFLHAMQMDTAWIMSFDNKRLLHNFKVNAGLKTDAQQLGGWEALDRELRGHTMGHYLSAIAMAYGSTGDPKFKDKGDDLIEELAVIQDELAHGGYLSAFPEKFIDRAIAGTEVWAPFYTLHKILAGLVDYYQFTGNKKSLSVAVKMGDWMYNKLISIDDKGMQLIQDRSECGGINEALYNLYAVTGKIKYKIIAEKFYWASLCNPLLARQDSLSGKHGNSRVPVIVGNARGYELTGNKRDRDISTFFYQTILEGHTYVTGGNSDGEHWGEPGKLSERLGYATTETCNTYNMLKLTRHLYAWEPRVEYMDYYERALYNHILSSQNPANGMVCYYHTLQPGGSKFYSTPFNSFWCCVGTGLENHVKYGEAIYAYSPEKELFINLFIPSELDWDERGLNITQTTDFPYNSQINFKINKAPSFSQTIKIRYPKWAQYGATLIINGKKNKISAKPGEYIEISRKWLSGDSFSIQFSMSLMYEAMPDKENRIAYMYGPIVLAGQLGTEDLDPKFGIPVFVTSTMKEVNKYIVKDKNNLVFRSESTYPKSVMLAPLFTTSQQKYTVYWDVFTPQEWKVNKNTYEEYIRYQHELDDRTIDMVGVGESQSERDHKIQTLFSYTPGYGGRLFRSARNDGFFQYEVEVDSQKENYLFLTVIGDWSPDYADIYVDGKILQISRKQGRVNEIYSDVTYAIPSKMTKGKERVTIRFQAKNNKDINYIYGLRILNEDI